jgi:4-hydroxy-3-methylbut-2-enyl diphosphate reductase
MYLVETPEDVARLHVRDPENLAYVTQTTLSLDDTARVVEALRTRFPNIRGPKRDDICYATQNRQDSVRALARDCQMVLVVGSRNSSNSNRLREVAETQGARAYMIDGPDDIRREWLEGVMNIGLTAGASAPEVLVQQVVERLRTWGVSAVREESGQPETIVFPLPRQLRGRT